MVLHIFFYFKSTFTKSEVLLVFFVIFYINEISFKNYFLHVLIGLANFSALTDKSFNIVKQ